MARWVRVLIALAEDPGGSQTAYNPNILFCALWALHMHGTHKFMGISMHMVHLVSCRHIDNKCIFNNEKIK